MQGEPPLPSQATQTASTGMPVTSSPGFESSPFDLLDMVDLVDLLDMVDPMEVREHG